MDQYWLLFDIGHSVSMNEYTSDLNIFFYCFGIIQRIDGMLSVRVYIWDLKQNTTIFKEENIIENVCRNNVETNVFIKVSIQNFETVNTFINTYAPLGVEYRVKC